MAELTIARATGSDRAGIVALLEAASLPLDGLDAALALALVAREDGVLVGCAAVERYEASGILRSVAVDEEHRGTGIGARLVAAAEETAAEEGVRRLYLLTETAAEWFPRLGFVSADRAAVPAAVAASPEFAYACPVSAIALQKVLRAADADYGAAVGKDEAGDPLVATVRTAASDAITIARPSA